jgi:o-succinylbenzoate---CoA ligase
LNPAEINPSRLALIGGGVALTYGDLAAHVRAAPSPDARLVAHPTLDAILALHTLIARRVPALLLHPRLTAGDTPPPAAAVPDGTLAVVYTSGTTGRARGAILSRAAFAAAAELSARNLGWRDDDRWLLALPFAHIGGLSILVRALLAGRTVVLGGPEVVARDRVTLMSLVPAQAARLLEAGWDPPAHVRAILLGGAAASPALLARAADRGWPILTTYGLTEACSQVATQRPGSVNRGDLGCGPPLIDARIIDGEIQVRGPTLLDGYLDGPAARDGDGWLATGDRGRLDAAGNLHVDGRRDDLIVSGGENVDPLEVERALEEHQAVAAACVVGVPDPTWGQIVAAAVVARAQRGADLRSHLDSRLARHKHPRRVVWLDAIPTTPTGKPDRRALRRALAT